MTLSNFPNSLLTDVCGKQYSAGAEYLTVSACEDNALSNKALTSKDCWVRNFMGIPRHSLYKAPAANSKAICAKCKNS